MNPLDEALARYDLTSKEQAEALLDGPQGNVARIRRDAQLKRLLGPSRLEVSTDENGRTRLNRRSPSTPEA